MTNKRNIIQYNSLALQQLGAELVFTQDRFGNYHSFYWQTTSVEVDNLFFDSDNSQSFFTPDSKDAYYERIKRILERRIPEQCHCNLKYQNQCFPFELVISPILPSEGEPTLVLVMGNLLKETEFSKISNSALPTNPDPYQQLLTNIARNIRRTLDLETIWQETVNSLGQALKVSRCLLLAEVSDQNQLEVKAEYCDSSFPSMLGMRLDLEKEVYLKQAMSCRTPITLENIHRDQFETKSILVIPTFYQKERNSIICLQQCDRNRSWNQAEIELVQELADQVGTAIAHATIYTRLQQASIETKEATRRKDEFLATTSHELRTPLNGIIGSLKLVLDGMADDEKEKEEFLEQAYNSAIHLLNLINDILDIAKIEAGKLEFEFHSISLNKIGEEVYKFAKNQALKKNLDFNIKIPPTYDEILVYADHQRLRQILLNLTGNALKFTSEGEIKIISEIIPQKIHHNGLDFPGIVKIRVEDTGIGVALEKQENLFEKFYQVDGTRTKSYGGTGLGLSISKSLAEAMGGEISFYSMGEGLGSIVTLTIPLYQLPVLKSDHF